MRQPESKHIYRYWVELRDRRDGSVRTLPLGAIQRIHLTARKNETRLPDEQMLQLQDESLVIEAKDIDELATQLRVRYPDETHERFLRSERDHEAERRKAEALDGLIEILVRAVAEDCCASKPVRSGTEQRSRAVEKFGPGRSVRRCCAARSPLASLGLVVRGEELRSWCLMCDPRSD